MVAASLPREFANHVFFGDRTSVVWWSGRYHPVFKTGTLAVIYL